MNYKNDTEKIIGSLDLCRKAEPSAEFLLKMENLALRYTAVTEKVSFRAIIGIAASFTLLVMVNMIIVNKKSDATTQLSNTEIATSSYDLIPTKTLYNE